VDVYGVGAGAVAREERRGGFVTALWLHAEHRQKLRARGMA